MNEAYPGGLPFTRPYTAGLMSTYGVDMGPRKDRKSAALAANFSVRHRWARGYGAFELVGAVSTGDFFLHAQSKQIRFGLMTRHKEPNG